MVKYMSVSVSMCVCQPQHGQPGNAPQWINVANSSSPSLSRVVEIRQGQGAVDLALQAKKKVTHAYTLCNAYTSAFNGPSSRSGPRYCPWLTSCHVAHLVNISKASTWLFSISWPGVWRCHMGGGGPGQGQAMKGVCVHVCVV